MSDDITDDRQISAESFVATIAANVENGGLSNSEFREFVISTLPIVSYPRPKGDD